MKITTRKLAVSAILLAAYVLLTRVFAFNTPLMKIGLGFAAIALCAMLYALAWAALVSALGDLIGSLAFPTGAYFPGFTLTAAVTGLIFGLCLYKRERSWIHAVLAAAPQLPDSLVPCKLGDDLFHHRKLLCRDARDARGAAGSHAAGAGGGVAAAHALEVHRKAGHGIWRVMP